MQTSVFVGTIKKSGNDDFVTAHICVSASNENPGMENTGITNTEILSDVVSAYIYRAALSVAMHLARTMGL